MSTTTNDVVRIDAAGIERARSDYGLAAVRTRQAVVVEDETKDRYVRALDAGLDVLSEHNPMARTGMSLEDIIDLVNWSLPFPEVREKAKWVANNAFEEAFGGVVAEARYDGKSVQLRLVSPALLTVESLAETIMAIGQHASFVTLIHPDVERAVASLTHDDDDVFRLTGVTAGALPVPGYTSGDYVQVSGANQIAEFVLRYWRDLADLTALDVAHRHLADAVAEMTSRLNNLPRDQWPQDIKDTLAALAGEKD